MMKPLLFVLAVGAVFGLMMPTYEPVPAPEAVLAAAKTETRRDTVLEQRGNGHFQVDAKVNGQPVSFVVDTGASVVSLTVDDARRIGVPVDPDDFSVIAQGASGPVRGSLLELGSVSIDGKSVSDVRAAVFEGLPVSLLGQSYLSRIDGVEMRGSTMTLR